MKSARAEFGDIVATTISSAGGGTGWHRGVGGDGREQFTQGNVAVTGDSLDVAINGSGFFRVTKNDGTTAYTRDGQFKLDKEGNLITNAGSAVMGYATDVLGQAIGTTPIP